MSTIAAFTPDAAPLATPSGHWSQQHPHLGAQWLSVRNPADAADVSASSVRKWWWACPQGHCYQASVSQRLHGRRRDCPTCDQSVGVRARELLSEWDCNRNADIDPAHLHSLDERERWWVCIRGHRWTETVRRRYVHRLACPSCPRR